MDINDRILLSAKALFFKFGLKNVTMDDISRDLGVSKKTLYEKYRNKKEIVETITRRFLENHQHEYANLLSQSKDAIDEVLKVLDSFSILFEKLHPRVVFDMQRYYPECWQIFHDYKHDFILAKIVQNLHRGMDEGLFRPTLEVDIIAKMRLEQVQIAIDPLIFPPERFSMKTIHRESMLVYLYGVSTLKGHQLINRYLAFNDDSQKKDVQ